MWKTVLSFFLAFGSATSTSSGGFGSAFGAQPTNNSIANPFGGQQPSQGIAPSFGAPSGSSVFGSHATPAFGTVASAENSRSSTPTFGATGGSAAPGFGNAGASVPAFGAGATNSGIGNATPLIRYVLGDDFLKHNDEFI